MICPHCQSESLQSRGEKHGRKQYQCNNCKKWSSEVKDYEENIIGLTKDKTLEEIAKRYSSEELRIIARGRGLAGEQIIRPTVQFDGDEVCIGFFTDSHIGEESFDDSLMYSFFDECAREKVQSILASGDIHEGMSNRPDQPYHLVDLGVSAQMDHAERLFKDAPAPIFCIDGNHDRWGVKANGLYMVRDLCKRVPGMTFLGSDSGEVLINGTRWMLWHGEDGASYATSYREQKIIESFTGGDKPQVLLTGHDHKQGSFFERNVHCVKGGALSYQSAWMKSTRKACHTGFWIIRATIKDGEIKKFSPTWYPFYN